jgi:putative photosynthetic complex assembly protein
MSDPFGDRPFPRGALIGATAVVAVAILAALTARLGDVGVTRLTLSTPIETRELRFIDRADGAVAVLDGRTGAETDEFAPGTNGFVRGALRGLARERKRQDIGAEPPFRLTRWADGRVTLDDPTTGRVVDLVAFGPTNAAAFTRLLTAHREAQ